MLGTPGKVSAGCYRSQVTPAGQKHSRIVSNHEPSQCQVTVTLEEESLTESKVTSLTSNLYSACFLEGKAEHLHHLTRHEDSPQLVWGPFKPIYFWMHVIRCFFPLGKGDENYIMDLLGKSLHILFNNEPDCEVQGYAASWILELCWLT